VIALAGGEKTITYGNILDLLGFCQEYLDNQSSRPMDNSERQQENHSLSQIQQQQPRTSVHFESPSIQSLTALSAPNHFSNVPRVKSTDSMRSIDLNASQAFVASYHKITIDLREALLQQASDEGTSCLEVVQDIFRKVDVNDSGAVTSQEMLTFLKAPELNLFVGEEHNLEKFCQLLLEQIDENG
jgi:Ca2+-binding EF-hand superfamily protein